MDKKKRIGLVYSYDTNWIAGAYYIVNIIKSLKTVEENNLPEIVLFYKNDEGLDLVKNINYPFISYYKQEGMINFAQRVISRVYSLLKQPNWFSGEVTTNLVNTIYPANDTHIRAKYNYFWIPDFQEDYYPDFFSPKEVRNRKDNQLKLSKSKQNIVFSSNDAKNDFIRLYPEHNNQLYVLQFASVVGDKYQSIEFRDLKVKYDIKAQYFIVPNQFWKHKNHLIVLKALTIFRKEHLNFQILFTGNEKDYRNANYIEELKTYTKDNYLDDCVKFLGFIDRDEQLLLMKNALAVIQPSLFEGWSTVVEDAKALNKIVILSDLPVHKEQINENVLFFEKTNEQQLYTCIISVLENENILQKINYENQIYNFGKKVISVLAQ